MHVQTSHHVDAGEQDADGIYEYYYEYDVTVFSEDGQSLVVRSYIDTPHEAHFLRAEVGSYRRLLTDSDMRSALAVEAIAHLRAQGKTEINWLSGRRNGYEPV